MEIEHLGRKRGLPGLRIALFAGYWLLPFAAFAQYAPDATAGLGAGYGNIALGQSTLMGTRELGKSDKPALRANGQAVEQSATAVQPSQAHVQALMAQIEPEYRRRVREDGEASAKRWLARKAWELGHDDGAAARRQSR